MRLFFFFFPSKDEDFYSLKKKIGLQMSFFLTFFCTFLNRYLLFGCIELAMLIFAQNEGTISDSNNTKMLINAKFFSSKSLGNCKNLIFPDFHLCCGKHSFDSLVDLNISSNHERF